MRPTRTLVALAVGGVLVAGPPVAFATETDPAPPDAPAEGEGDGSGEGDPGGDPGDGGGEPAGPVVVATGLDNPRQLGWTPDGSGLLIAEAGRGGDACTTEPLPPDAPPEAEPFEVCAGATGAVSVLADPGAATGPGEVVRVVEGLLSAAGRDGSFALGSSGAAAVDGHGYLVTVNGGPPDALAPVEDVLPPALAEQFASLVVAAGDDSGSREPVPWVDLGAVEAEENPDGAQVESNPYAVLAVDPAPGEDGDEYALVADAGANAVWKVVPRLAAEEGDAGEDRLPEFDVSVFVSFPTPPDDDTTPEFVPTALALDLAGAVYVAGLGSEQPGSASVVKFSPDGEELERWDGFTGLTGVAVGRDGTLFVSQVFGAEEPPAEEPPAEEPPAEEPPAQEPPAQEPPIEEPTLPGSVVRVSPDGTRTEVPVPFPSGVAVDGDGHVYVAAFSISDSDGTEASDQGPALEPGQVWRVAFDPDEPGGPGTPPELPEPTDGQWVPSEDMLPPEGFTFPACGTELTVLPGDVFTVEELRTLDSAGNLHIAFRGNATVDLRTADGREVDELDVSGPGSAILFTDGDVYFTLQPNSIVFVETLAQAAALEAAGLPAEGFYYERGTFSAYSDAPATPDGTPTETVTEFPDAEDVQPLCDLLGDAAPEEPGTALSSVNDPDASGSAEVTVVGDRLEVVYTASGLAAGLPHAAHLHFGPDARHECPTVAVDDADGDGLVSLAEGGPAYGPVVVSLTTSGDTDPGSALALDRFPTATSTGRVAYLRTDLPATPDVAAAVAAGQVVLVVHGVDLDGDGAYAPGTPGDDGQPGPSTEATLPALCGVVAADGAAPEPPAEEPPTDEPAPAEAVGHAH